MRKRRTLTRPPFLLVIFDAIPPLKYSGTPLLPCGRSCGAADVGEAQQATSHALAGMETTLESGLMSVFGNKMKISGKRFWRTWMKARFQALPRLVAAPIINLWTIARFAKRSAMAPEDGTHRLVLILPPSVRRGGCNARTLGAAAIMRHPY